MDIFKLSGFFPALGISVLRTVVGTVAAVLVCSFLGYMFTKEEMPGRKFMYRFLVMTMYINGGLISTFIVMKSYGLLNTFWIYILPMMISAYNIVLIKTYMESLPGLPGGNPPCWTEPGISRCSPALPGRCQNPLLRPLRIRAVGHWNSWFDNHIYTRVRKFIDNAAVSFVQLSERVAETCEQIKNTSNLSSIENAMGTISPKGVRMTITVQASLPIIYGISVYAEIFVKGYYDRCGEGLNGEQKNPER